MFFITIPLILAKGIDKLASSYVLADLLIFATALTFLGYAAAHHEDKGEWANGVEALNERTWLTMVGSAIYSYEGVGVVLPIYEVTSKPRLFKRLLCLVMLTNLVLFTGFG